MGWVPAELSLPLKPWDSAERGVPGAFIRWEGVCEIAGFGVVGTERGALILEKLSERPGGDPRRDPGA